MPTSFWSPACLVSLAVAASVFALPPAVQAETVFKRDGTQVRGKVVKEDETTLVVETPEGKRKVPKKDIEVLPPVSPEMAFLAGIPVAGGGYLYLGKMDSFLLYLGLGVAAGGITAGTLKLIRPITTKEPQMTVAFLLAYAVPMLLGALESQGAARAKLESPRFHIEY
ncbi:MAG: hypothetical protein VKS61_09365 [Candidatus Sericytochromatia bacterium]|nr:hypothetical protein [Candidatus Sericytochromatia bacterium]